MPADFGPSYDEDSAYIDGPAYFLADSEQGGVGDACRYFEF